MFYKIYYGKFVQQLVHVIKICWFTETVEICKKKIIFNMVITINPNKNKNNFGGSYSVRKVEQTKLDF